MSSDACGRQSLIAVWSVRDCLLGIEVYHTISKRLYCAGWKQSAEKEEVSKCVHAACSPRTRVTFGQSFRYTGNGRDWPGFDLIFPDILRDKNIFM